MGGTRIGLDTGGTYTDAVAIDAAAMATGPAAIRATAKRLTTHAALAEGVGAALAAVMETAGIAAEDVGLVALSTTLATNALVEGQGGRAALVLIGFDAADVARQGLGAALAGAPLLRIAGGHDATGRADAPLDLDALRRGLPGAEAYAVCARFATRNPEHERAAAAEIAALTGRPVTPSHALSARLGGPKRALTALLNAQLTPLLDRLIAATLDRIAALGLRAPLMVVRGDGALVSAEVARARPVETILSGPAASLVGAGWLTGLRTALVADLGGTTTDLGVLRDGRPRLDPDGARVGPHRTMVEAVAMATHGLGGDSRLDLDPARSGVAALRLGPGRVEPVARFAERHPELVAATLARQAAQPRPGPEDAVFLHARRTEPALEGAAGALLARLSRAPEAADIVLADRSTRAAFRTLEAEGRVGRAAPTPTDALHALGRFTPWNAEAARTALDLLARRRGADGLAVAADGQALADAALARFARISAKAALAAALAEDGYPEGLETTPFAEAALSGRRGLVAPRLALTAPLVALGAGAATHYPAIGALLGADTRIPAHADVANAVGAVVGGVQIRRTGAVTCPSDGRYRAHLPTGPQDFETAAAAETALRDALVEAARAEAVAAGAEAPTFADRISRREVTVEGRVQYVEAEVTVTASGRPRLAKPEETPG